MSVFQRRDLSVAACITTFLLGLTATANAGEVPAGPNFSKVFSPDTIGLGNVSTLTFSIDNTFNESPADELAFTDTLPAGLTLAAPAIVSNSCGGTLTAPNGGITITFSDGQIGAFAGCTIVVNVTASTVGVHMNVSSDLTWLGGNSGTASDDLTVDAALPGFSKSFSPSSVPFGSRSTLTLTIDNSLNTAAILGLSFTDNLPTGMLVADPANASTTCGTAPVEPVFTADPGTSLIDFSYLPSNPAFPAVAASATCTVIVDVIGGAFGDLGNVTSDLVVNSGTEQSAGKAAAVLEVTGADDLLRLTKEFTDDPVVPGGTVTLEFTISNGSRFDSASDIAFTDSLPGETFPFNSLLDNDCGGTVDGVGTPEIDFSGGSLPPEGSCTIRVLLDVPPGTTPGAYTNTTGAITGDVGGSPEIGNTASDVLFVNSPPEFTFTKEFTDNPVGAGASATLEFTITNLSALPLTDIAFEDDLNTAITGLAANGLVAAGGLDPEPIFVCGGVLTIFDLNVIFPSLPPVPPDPTKLIFSGGNLAAAGMADDSCTLSVVVDVPAGIPSGAYTNTTGDISAKLGAATVVQPPASDDLVVVGAPQLSKEFTDDPVAPGGTVTLEFTLSLSENALADATGIAFSDDLTTLFADLIATGVGPNDCADSTVDITTVPTLIDFSSGTLMPGDTCSFTVTLSVPVWAPSGFHANTTSEVTATVDGVAVTGSPGEDDLLVSGLILNKEFTDDPVIAGGTANLRFTLDNTSSLNVATGITFKDDLDAVLPGLVALAVTSPPPIVCPGILSGTSLLTYSGGSILPGDSCSYDVTVAVPISTPDDFYLNRTEDESAFIDGITFDLAPATDKLEVNSTILELTKAFTDDPVLPGDPVTLKFTITNLSATETVDSFEFSDDLDAALPGLVTNLTNPISNDCPGMATSAFGTGTFSFIGGPLGPEESCTIRLALDVPAAPLSTPPPYINTTSDVTGLVGGLSVFGNAANDELIVQEVTFSKEFTGDPAAPGGTATLSFTIVNFGTSALSDLAFSDDLNLVLSGLEATGLPAAGVCGPGSMFAGTSFLTLTGASLAAAGDPGDSCTFAVTVTVPAAPLVCGTFTNATSDLSQLGIPVADPATALVDVIAESDGPFLQVDGEVWFEAENFDSSVLNGTDPEWLVLSGLPPLEVSNEAAIKAGDNNNGMNNLDPNTGSYTTYEVMLEAGTQHVWIRGRGFNTGKNSIFFQFGGEPFETVHFNQPPLFGVWRWVKLPLPYELTGASVVTLRVIRREQKTEIDKLFITTDPGAVPVDLGEDESLRATPCDDLDGDGIPDIIDPDIDGDGMDNIFEEENGLDPRDPDDADDDNDGDGLSNLEESEKGTDPNDPDSDGDGIGDDFDELPNDPSNACDPGGNADYATFSQSVTIELTCAANVSIEVLAGTLVLTPGGHLTLIAPFVSFASYFEASWLTVINADPCPGCDNSVAPEVIETSPVDFATDVPVDSNIDITFNKPVTVTGDWFQVICDGVDISAGISVTDNDPLFTLDPSPDLGNNEVCEVTVFAANVTDDDGIDPPDNMDADFVFEFTVVAGSDIDGDGVPDAADNCTDIANPLQRDSNGDSIGNRCDADIAGANDCTVNFLDLGALKSNMFTTAADPDFDGDGVVNFVDLGLMKAFFFAPPGPSADGCN